MTSVQGKNLRIDGERLWRSLMAMARIGATAKGGVCRLALTDEDKQARRSGGAVRSPTNQSWSTPQPF